VLDVATEEGGDRGRVAFGRDRQLLDLRVLRIGDRVEVEDRLVEPFRASIAFSAARSDFER
jgi:hypothetical protein